MSGDSMAELAQRLRVAALVMDHLPEAMDYFGLLGIDSIEAEKVASTLHDAAAAIEALSSQEPQS